MTMLHKRIAHHVVQHVFPTKHNGFIPRLLKEPAIWAMLGVSVALFSFSQFLHVTDYLNIRAEVYPSALVQLTNQDRTALGMKPLSISPVLEQAAKLKAQDMVANNYFAHTSPTGSTPWYWFGKAGYKFLYAGENLAVNFSESSDVQNAWLNSPTHRANVLNPNFTEIGIATAQGQYKGNQTLFVVELFGMPARQKVTQVTAIAAPVSPLPKPTSQTAPIVAGESVQAELLIVDDSPSFVSVQNTDPTLEEKEVVPNEIPRISWFSKFLLNIDTYIAIILEIAVVAIILALTGLTTREWQKHHRKHMVYGILMTVILTSFLFIGRIGVFAETPRAQPQLPYLEY